MHTLSAIRERRAIKKFDADHVMTDEEINQLLSLALLSPTAFNLQHWRFVLINDQQLRHQIRAVAWDQAQVTDASMLIVLCADLLAWEREPGRYWQNAPQPVQDFLIPAIGRYYKGRPQVQRDEAMRSGGIAAQTLMLAAKAIGYDSCPMTGFDFAEVARLINLPAEHAVVLLLAIGKATTPAMPRGGQLARDEVVVLDRFPTR